ncbi:AraC family transcriptional regulator [Marispirochaeta sp.]|uniref:AraC family transcriptional regulator n=1 Tax=Marispirochaeta sp. TaxID=2038653 RepID=UPI0029C72D83|nr:AraC family transcriptional regulator [Marispirochaeta sp.]
MNYHSPGVLEPSKIFLYSASSRARSLFYYLLCIGHYHCSSEYLVARQRYDSFLLIYTLSGAGYVLQWGEYRLVGTGSIALLDCYQAHTYKASKKGWEILWMHIDGPILRSWFSALSQGGEPVIQLLPSAYVMERNLYQIFSVFDKQEAVNEARISQLITNVMTELYLARFAGEKTTSVDAIEEVLTYISMHIEQPLSVEDLARQANLSPYYFSRLFKQSTGFPPHEYMLNHRVANAKYLLRTTDFPIKKVASCCGFSTASSFCTNFKKRVGSSPLQYREREKRYGKNS